MNDKYFKRNPSPKKWVPEVSGLQTKGRLKIKASSKICPN